MKKLILVVLFLNGCTYAPVRDAYNTSTYAPVSTYSSVYSPTTTTTYPECKNCSDREAIEYAREITNQLRREIEEHRQREREDGRLKANQAIRRKQTIQVIPNYGRGK